MFETLRHRRDALALGAILFAALLLRIANLGAEPYWAEEIVTVQGAVLHRGVGEMLRYLALTDLHPPLYPLLVRGWAALFGDGEAAVRSLSVLCSVATVGVVARLGSRMYSRKAGLLAAAVFAVLPMQIEYGQEARPYALVCLAGAVAALALWERRNGGSWRWTALYVVAATVGMYAHYSFAFVLFATATWWLYDGRGVAFREWLLAHAAVVVAFSPWLFHPLYRILLARETLSGLPTAVLNVRTTDLLASTADALVWMSKHPHQPLPLLEGKLLAMAALAVGALAAVRNAASRAMLAASSRASAFALWLCVGTLLALVLSPQALPYTSWIERHALFAGVPLALLLGMLWAALSARVAAVTAAIFLASLLPFVAAVVADDYDWDPLHRVDEAAAYLDAYAQPGDLIITDSASDRVALLYYLEKPHAVVALRPLAGGALGDEPADPRIIGLVAADSQTRSVERNGTYLAARMGQVIAREGAQRVWTYDPDDIENPQKYWFMDRGWARTVRPLGGLFMLSLFESPQALQERGATPDATPPAE